MAYLTDKEKRLLFSALTREKKVCVEVDKECCRETYEDTLESIVKNLEKKFYYDRFEKEIRAKAIDEFFNELCKASESVRPVGWTQRYCVVTIDKAMEIVEKLKAGGEE